MRLISKNQGLKNVMIVLHSGYIFLSVIIVAGSLRYLEPD